MSTENQPKKRADRPLLLRPTVNGVIVDLYNGGCQFSVDTETHVFGYHEMDALKKHVAAYFAPKP